MKRIFFYNSFSNIMLELVVWMIYLKEQGWSLAEVAMLEGIFTISQVIFEFPSGVISDKLGHKKTLLLGEIFCILYLLTYFFPHIHIIVYLGFIMFALGLAFISGTDISMLYESISEEEKNSYLKYSGYFNAIAAFSVAIGNILGGWIAQISWNLLFILAILFRTTALIIGFKIKEPDIKKQVDTLSLKSIITELFNFIKHQKNYICLIAGLGFSTAAVDLSYQYGPLIMQKFSFDTGMISTVFGSLSLLGAVAGLLTYKLTQKVSENILLIILLLFGLTLLLSLFIHNMLIVLFSLITVNVIFEMWNIIFENKIQEVAYADIRATVISTGNVFISGLLALSSGLISLVGEKISLVWIIGSIGSIFLIIALISTLFYISKQK